MNTAKEVERIGGIAYPYTCDVSNAAEIHKTAEKVRQDVGEITILVNNAGFLNGGSLLDLKEKDIRRTFDVNILAQFWVIRERERNVLFNDALNTFYLRLYGVRHMVKDHSDSEKGNPLSPHRLLSSIKSKGSFICTIPQTG